MIFVLAIVIFVLAIVIFVLATTIFVLAIVIFGVAIVIFGVAIVIFVLATTIFAHELRSRITLDLLHEFGKPSSPTLLPQEKGARILLFLFPLPVGEG